MAQQPSCLQSGVSSGSRNIMYMCVITNFKYPGTRGSCSVCPPQDTASPRGSWSSSQVRFVRERIVKFDSFFADIYYGRVDHEWAVDIEVAFIEAIALSYNEKLII